MSKICPVCQHVFKGNGWDGIDAHWRAKHEQLMPYERAWPLIEAGTYPKSLQPHRYILAVRIEKDEDSGEPINVVTTNLNVNSEHPAYDKIAMNELTKHVEAWQAVHFEMVTIEGPG